VDPAIRVHRRQARVFDCEEDAAAAIYGGNINAGDVVVARCEGPKGGQGMREMLAPAVAIVGMGLGREAGHVTGGCFSGATSGAAIGHVSPEAAEGWPLALAGEGGSIFFGVPGGVLALGGGHGEASERRRAALKPHAPRVAQKSCLARYSALVSPAMEGAVLKTKSQKELLHERDQDRRS
jgi:dihydroxy-acid dehydratase